MAFIYAISQVCMEKYANEDGRRPRVLNCQHTFCTTCLDGPAVKQMDRNVIVCPTCRDETSLGSEGVHGLRINFTVEHLVSLIKDKSDRVDPTGPASRGEGAAALMLSSSAILHCANCDDSSPSVATKGCVDCKTKNLPTGTPHFDQCSVVHAQVKMFTFIDEMNQSWCGLWIWSWSIEKPQRWGSVVS